MEDITQEQYDAVSTFISLIYDKTLEYQQNGLDKEKAIAGAFRDAVLERPRNPNAPVPEWLEKMKQG